MACARIFVSLSSIGEGEENFIPEDNAAQSADGCVACQNKSEKDANCGKTPPCSS
jgi:hypothetical protein